MEDRGKITLATNIVACLRTLVRMNVYLRFLPSCRSIQSRQTGSGWIAKGLKLARIIGLVVSLSLFLVGAALAGDSVSAVDPSIAKLERKLFHNEYPKETVEARLDRLEKMVFGEAKDGAQQERLKNLLSAVPNVDSPADSQEEDAAADKSVASEGSAGSAGGGRQSDNRAETASPPANASNYPAVSAMEQRLLGKDFSAEPVIKRLERLETKVFGRPSGLDDLSERVDRLKQRTGIDLAKQAPPGTDWADDDEDSIGPYTSPSVAGSGEDGKSFSGRDLRKDFGIPSVDSGGMNDRWAGTGTYGMGNAAPPRRVPPTAQVPGPRQVDEDVTAAPPRSVPGGGAISPGLPAGAQPLGLNQQVGALEQEIFGKTYVRDPLPARLSRLESTVFPQQKPAIDKALPDRVSRLLAVVPLSRGGQSPRAVAEQGARSRQVDPDFADFEDFGGAQTGQAPPRPGSGLSKIINSISSFLTGGGYMGGYPMPPANVVTDPQTGLWLDPRTGSLIDPITGAIVGQRAMAPGIGSGMGGFGSFSNGFSPYGVPSFGTGYGSGMQFGFGSGGFGIGRPGFGIWP